MLSNKNTLGDLLKLLEIKLGEHVCIGRKDVLEYSNLPILECIKRFLYRDQWAYVLLEYIGKDLDEEIRELLMNGIKEEMMAFQLYIKCDYLTDKEDNFLKSKFEGKLPNAENQLKEGIIIRKKDG